LHSAPVHLSPLCIPCQFPHPFFLLFPQLCPFDPRVTPPCPPFGTLLTHPRVQRTFNLFAFNLFLPQTFPFFFGGTTLQTPLCLSRRIPHFITVCFPVTVTLASSGPPYVSSFFLSFFCLSHSLLVPLFLIFPISHHLLISDAAFMHCPLTSPYPCAMPCFSYVTPPAPVLFPLDTLFKGVFCLL